MTNPPTTPAAPPRPLAGPPREYHFPHFERRALSNGLRIVVAPVTKLPLVTVHVLIEAGAATEAPGKEGLATLTGRLLLEGTESMDGATLAERLEQIGASIEAHADWDVTAVSLTTLSSQVANALALVREIVRAPAFPEREVQRLKEERLTELLQLRAEPRGLADEMFSAALYAPSARYARDEAGTEQSIALLTREDLRQFHAERYRPAGITIVFAGDITADDAAALANTHFGDWTGDAPAPAPAGIDTVTTARMVRIVAKADAPQSELRIGHLGLPRRTPAYFEATVMNAVLGGLFSSRINMNLREEHGYTYGASSFFDWRREAGPFMISTAVKSDATGPAVHEVLKEIDRMRSEDITADELTLATSYLDGVFPIRFETTAAIAGALANQVIYSLPDDYYDIYRERVRNITTADVLQSARDHIDPAQLHIVVVGDPATVTEQLASVTGMTPEIVDADRSE